MRQNFLFGTGIICSLGTWQTSAKEKHSKEYVNCSNINCVKKASYYLLNLWKLRWKHKSFTSKWYRNKIRRNVDTSQVFRLHGTSITILCTICNYSGLSVGGESARGVMSICHKEFIFQETRFSVYGPPPNGEALNRVTVLTKLKMGGRTLHTLKHR